VFFLLGVVSALVLAAVWIVRRANARARRRVSETERPSA
jgi:flagellar biogenesis protein FliO